MKQGIRGHSVLKFHRRLTLWTDLCNLKLKALFNYKFKGLLQQWQWQLSSKVQLWLKLIKPRSQISSIIE